MTTIYDVIRRPLVTEKSNYQSNKLHQYSFEVASEATRTLVKDAIETAVRCQGCKCEYHEYGCQAQSSSQPAPAGAGSWYQESDRYPGRGKYPRDL